jgi:hypothetical protein
METYKVVNKRTQEVIASGLDWVAARKIMQECYEKAGLKQEYTGISVTCNRQGKILRRYELDYLLDKYPNFFQRKAYYSPSMEAFVIDDYVWNELEDTFDHFVIESDN